MNDSEELAEKYHKLFQDYTRIKAQHAVLKKAVVKEQTENAAMQTAMKEKEQEVRKSLKDLDLLSFHNQRLTKRIENLQTLAANKPGGSWLMGGGSVKKELEKSQSTLEAATIDLQAKIEENEKLHQQLYEINALYPRHVTELQGKIQALEKQNQELQVDVQRAGVANEDTITMIRKEKEEVEKELGLIRDALAGQLQDEQHAHHSSREKLERLENELERLSHVELDLESLQAENTKLQSELETLKWISSELSHLQENYSNLERDKIQIEKAHSQLSQQYAGLRQAEEGLRRALAQEQGNLKSSQEHNQHLMRDLEAIRGEASAREQGHQNRIAHLESELNRVRKEQQELQIQCDELKVAEQTAKEGESRTKADLAKDLSGMESSLKVAETRVVELEQIKEALENELKETKQAFEETKASLVTELEHHKSNVTPGSNGTESQGQLEAVEKKTEAEGAEEGHATEDEGAEKEIAPLSKKARKKKAAAAAAAAAAASAEMKETDDQGPSETNKDSTNKSDTEAGVAKADAEEQERKLQELEVARKAAEDALKAEIESLRVQVEASQESSVSKQQELSAAQAALENVRDEKASLSSSLEMHVELTMQLQQEIEDLKTDMAKKSKSSGVNGTGTKGSPVMNDSNDEESILRTRHKSSEGSRGESTPQRATTPVPTATSPSDSSKGVEAKDEATQVDKIEAIDKAVQSDSVVQVDEGTQADLADEALEIATATADETKVLNTTKDSKDSNDGKDGKDGSAAKTTTSSRQSMLFGNDDVTSSATTAEAAAMTNQHQSNQSNREYLIKKHYETKVQNITEQLQLSDGRYARLHREFGLLKELLLETVKDKESIVKEYEQLKTKNHNLMEELATAKEDYRAQVETMTNYMKSLGQGQE